jgi:hypothetical protein
VSAGGNYKTDIFVFRGGKYWQFDNKPKRKKPLGSLVEGAVLAKNKWPGIHFPGGIGNNGDNFIIIYANKWSEWTPDGQKIVDEEDIKEKKIEIPDEPDGKIDDSGALVLTDEQNGKFAKISRNRVCYLLIKNNKCYWSGKCLNVNEDEYKFPPNIIAAIKPKDNNWYYFNKDGKYCKRQDKDFSEVNIN